MATIQCKNCGEIIRVPNEASEYVCPHCAYEGDILPEEMKADESALAKTLPRQGTDASPLAKDVFSRMAKFEDSDALTDENNSGEEARLNAIYYSALSKMGGQNITYYERALEELLPIRGWRDTEELIEECEEKIATLEEEERQLLLTAQKQAKSQKLFLAVGIPLFVATIVAAVLFFTVMRPKMRYQKAEAFLQSGDSVSAYEIWTDLASYKDSSQRAADIFEAYKEQKPSVAGVGDSLYFGQYEQDGNRANGKEDIAWTVLEKKNKEILLICNCVLDSVPYAEEEVPTTWEESNLRKWLAGDFYQKAFSEKEQNRIVPTQVPADENPYYETNPGKDTHDKVFILSYSEALQYYPTEKERLCQASEVTAKKGVKVLDYGGLSRSAYWFLRTPGFDETMISYVQYEGELRYLGTRVTTPYAGVRPVMWIKAD